MQQSDVADAPRFLDELPPKKRRHPWRWVAVAVIALLLLEIVRSFATSENMRWDVVAQYLFDPFILDGLVRTIELTLVAMTIAILVGAALAIMRLSPNPVLSTLSWFYIWFLRGTPVLVQLLFWFFLAAVFPRIVISIPWGPTLVSLDTNTVIGQFTAAILGLGLAEGAYMGEIIRAGIISVDKGQTEAGEALGMTRSQLMRKIVLPQAMRFIVPPTGNQVISMTKMTSLVLVIALPDLLTSAQLIYSRNFLQIPLLTVACVWYLVIVSILTVGQYFLENHYGRSAGTTKSAKSSRFAFRRGKSSPDPDRTLARAMETSI